jgi:hypothetical protein
MADVSRDSGLGRGFGAVWAMTDEELLISEGWYKEPARDGKEWRHKDGGMGRYDMWSALKLQKWLEVGREAGNAKKS